jgi:hypothetical protein
VFRLAPGTFRAAADLLHPRTFFRTLSRVDPLVDATRELTASVETLTIRTDQLLALQRLDWEQRDEVANISRWLTSWAIEAHVLDSVARAPLALDPFPHVVVEDLLPPDIYARIVEAVPPAVFFAGTKDEHWAVPSGIAPLYCRSVWTFVANTLVGDILHRALNAKFNVLVREYVRGFCPDFTDDERLDLHPSDGRLMLRRPGYNLTPHRDPKWGFVTAILYLARPGDSEEYGTQLYAVREDVEAPSGAVYYLEPSQCELVRAVPFRSNSMLVFLNSVGAHGASIPADAPARLERYIYQFRLGPTSKMIASILQRMPPDRASQWAGSKMGRASM